MKKLLAMVIATLLAFPVVVASYQEYGNYDYSYNKDYNYVRYSETEDAYNDHNHNSCGYYDYDYYGSTCSHDDSYSYHRSRNFEFGNYHEDVQISGNSGSSYYESYRYPYYYDDPYYDGYYHDYQPYNYDLDYEGGRYSMAAGVYGYLPYRY